MSWWADRRKRQEAARIAAREDRLRRLADVWEIAVYIDGLVFKEVVKADLDVNARYDVPAERIARNLASRAIFHGYHGGNIYYPTHKIDRVEVRKLEAR